MFLLLRFRNFLHQSDYISYNYRLLGVRFIIILTLEGILNIFYLTVTITILKNQKRDLYKILHSKVPTIQKVNTAS